MNKKCYLYKELNDKKTQCQTCAHQCLILPGQVGTCGVRQNVDGKLFLLVYGRAIAANIDPIEKKPFFHFLPGSQSFSVATVGCNFRCDNCQNWDISQFSKQPKVSSETIQDAGFELPPEKIVADAIKNNCPSISYTYTEPTIFLEYALDTMKLAKKKGLKNCWVSNGYLTERTLDLIAPYLDAINVDLKSFDDKFYQKNCGARLEPILKNLKAIKKHKIWLEITTLVIPTLTDSEKNLRQIAEFIANELGPETPWHISAFSGAISWKLQDLPDTPAKTLKKAYQFGKQALQLQGQAPQLQGQAPQLQGQAGLKYVYSGNIPGLDSEHTYCSKCNTLNIKRFGYSIERLDKNGKCFKCGEDLDLIT